MSDVHVGRITAVSGDDQSVLVQFDHPVVWDHTRSVLILQSDPVGPFIGTIVQAAGTGRLMGVITDAGTDPGTGSRTFRGVASGFVTGWTP